MIWFSCSASLSSDLSFIFPSSARFTEEERLAGAGLALLYVTFWTSLQPMDTFHFHLSHVHGQKPKQRILMFAAGESVPIITPLTSLAY